MGTVEFIYMAKNLGDELFAVQEVEVVADKGIVGDRNYGLPADASISLIEAEQIDHFNAAHATDFEYGQMRRSIVTRGVDLNGLVGKTFTVGGLRIEGVELCEPCSHLASMTTSKVLPGMVHRGGLRGRILDSGRLQVGASVAVELPETA